MSIGLVAFLAGLFVVPIGLLRWSHRLRRRTLRQHRAFWGAVIGHCVAGTVAMTFGMIPPDAWMPDETVRGFFGLWALLLFPILGGLGGALSSNPRR